MAARVLGMQPAALLLCEINRQGFDCRLAPSWRLQTASGSTSRARAGTRPCPISPLIRSWLHLRSAQNAQAALHSLGRPDLALCNLPLMQDSYQRIWHDNSIAACMHTRAASVAWAAAWKECMQGKLVWLLNMNEQSVQLFDEGPDCRSLWRCSCKRRSRAELSRCFLLLQRTQRGWASCV